MREDPRCCGSGTCIIDTGGRCWCGQQWNGQTMSHAPLAAASVASSEPAEVSPGAAAERESPTASTG